MLTLHDYLPSQNGWKVRTLLSLLSIPYRLEPVSIFAGESRTDGFLTKNPAGAVPVLELEDGRTIAESNAILWYLADGTPFAPEDPFDRAKVLQWMFFEQYYVEPTIGSLRFWTLTGRLDQNAALVPAKREGARRALRALQLSLEAARFLAGDRLSIADIAIYAYGHVSGDAGFEIGEYPALAAYFDRVADAIGPDHPVHEYGPEAASK
ncbi:MAG: glutathione S-transferase family protein [Pseudomonadota bacterium]